METCVDVPAYRPYFLAFRLLRRAIVAFSHGRRHLRQHAPTPLRSWSVTPRNTIAVDTTAVPAMMELSGAAYRGSFGGSSHSLIAVQDSGNQLVSITFTLAANGAADFGRRRDDQIARPRIRF